jgi:hypothetical protein
MKTFTASFGLAIIFLGAFASADAGSLDGSPITVACGTTITVTDAIAFQTLTLDSTDPILSAVCPKNGLTIKNTGASAIDRGLTLDCQTNYATPIRGSAKGVGIALSGPFLTVQNCYVSGFANGISVNGDGATIADNQVENSSDDGFDIKDTLGLKSSKLNGTFISGNRAFNNGGWGFTLQGNLMSTSQGSFFSNIADGNASGGFSVKGEGNGLFNLEAFNNGGPGISVTSTNCCSGASGQFLSAVVAANNAGPGIVYSAKDDASNCVGSLDPGCAGGTFFPLGLDTEAGAVVVAGNGGSCPAASLPFVPGVCPIVKGKQCTQSVLDKC